MENDVRLAEAINLLDNPRCEEYRAKFNEFKERLDFFSETNEIHNLKAGDKVLFLNGYDIPMITEILGFDEEKKMYLLWDCYWFSVPVGQRLIQKL